MSEELTELQELGLAFGALYAEVNGLEHDSLIGMDEIDEDEKQSAIEMFDEAWDVKTKDDLLECLKWLFEEGHRKDYAEEDDNDPNDIVAWDLSRAINNARFGVIMGLLTEKEAWEWITKCAEAMKNKFSSWDSYAKNFIRGRTYWNIINEQENDNDEFNDAIELLLDEDNEDSPWNDIEITDGDGGAAMQASLNLVNATFTPEQWAAIVNQAAAAAAASNNEESSDDDSKKTDKKTK
jgi:hypothetical protein